VWDITHIEGNIIATAGDDKKIKIWEISSNNIKESINVLEGHSKGVMRLLTMGNNILISGSDD